MNEKKFQAIVIGGIILILHCLLNGMNVEKYNQYLDICSDYSDELEKEENL